MSRFKRIKNTSTKKSSVSINEKIAALNKELEKTGMSNVSEMMTTNNVYSTSTYVPPQERVEGDVPNSSNIGGDGFTQSSAGSGTAGHAPTYSSVEDLFNSGVDHPIFKTPSSNNVPVSFGVVQWSGSGAGTNYGIIEEGNIIRGVLGGFVAGGTRPASYYVNIYESYLATNQHSPGYFSDEQIEEKRVSAELATQVENIRIEAAKQGLEFIIPWQGYRPPNMFVDSQPYGTSYNHPTKGLLILAGFNLLGMPNRYTIQEPKPPGTTDPIRRGLEDPPIYPGPIATLFGLGQRAFDWLRGKAEERKKKRGGGKPNKPGSGFPDPKPEPDPTKPDPKPEPDPTKPDPKPEPDPTKPDPKPEPDPTKPDPKPEPDPTKPDPKPEPDYKKNRKNNRPDVTGGGEAEELLQTAVATMLDFTDNPIKYAVQGLLNLGGLLTGQDGLATSFNNLVHHTNNNNPLHPDFRKNDPSSDNYEGPAEVQTSDENRQNIVNALNDSISNLNGGKGPRNPNGNLYDDEIEQVSKDMKNNYYNDQTNQAYNTFYNSFHSLPTGGDRGDGKPVTTIKVNNGEFEKLDSNYWFTDPRDANPLASDESIPSNDKQLPSTVISNIIHGVENQATGNGVWTPGSDGNPFYSDETKTTVVGTQYNTQQSFSAKPPKSNKNVKESYITEGVGLGLYEPEAMNVDLADIRKGIMPEYPKKPPAKMIDGYHEKSRIRSREAKNIIPTLKIDKVDLIRNHRLKPSEADEMMNTIKMINDYIKKHPEDFIHAQMRYPVDDPRLAELNWKMDQMLDAGKEYLDSNFKENQTLFKRATERTKRNTALTNPDYIQKHYDELRGTIKTEPKPTINRKSPSRFFKKPKKKSSMEAINDKIKQLDKDLLI